MRTHESESDLSVEPRTSCDQATDEHDVISKTRKRRRLTHTQITRFCTFYDDFVEDEVIQVQAACSVPAYAKNVDEKRPAVGTIGATGFEGDLLPVAMETSCQPGESEFGGHEHTVQLLEKRDDTARLPLCLKPWYEDRIVSTTETCGVVSSGRSATELVVLRQGAKTESLQHDKSALVDLCNSSTLGF